VLMGLTTSIENAWLVKKKPCVISVPPARPPFLCLSLPPSLPPFCSRSHSCSFALFLYSLVLIAHLSFFSCIEIMGMCARVLVCSDTSCVFSILILMLPSTACVRFLVLYVCVLCVSAFSIHAWRDCRRYDTVCILCLSLSRLPGLDCSS
jgi:hypothetical protein